MTATIKSATRNRARLTALLASTALIGAGVMPAAVVVLSGTSALATDGGEGGAGSSIWSNLQDGKGGNGGGLSTGGNGGAGGDGGTPGTGGTGSFALSYAAKTVTAPRTELGLRSDKAFALDGALLTLRGRAAWAHDTNTDRNAQATFQALPGASFVVNGAAASRNAALTSASAELAWRGGLSLAATFDGEFSDTTRSYAGKGVVRYAW